MIPQTWLWRFGIGTVALCTLFGTLSHTCRAQDPGESPAIEKVTAPLPQEKVRFVSDQGKLRANLTVELALTPMAQAYGLMNRTTLPPNNGMLFIFTADKTAEFWMRNTLIPLDLIFIDNRAVVTQIYPNAKPLDETILASTVPVRAVLEIGGGEAKRLRLQVGDHLASATFRSFVGVTGPEKTSPPAAKPK